MFFRRSFQLCAVLIFVALLTSFTSAQSESDPHPAPQEPKIAAASADAQLTMSTFRYPADLQVKLFAAEPMVANPVAIDVDGRGRVFVCETFRQELGVEDNREHPEWLLEDLAAQSVDDRIKYIKKHEPNIKLEYLDQDDRVRLLVDNDQDVQRIQQPCFPTVTITLKMAQGQVSWRSGTTFFTQTFRTSGDCGTPTEMESRTSATALRLGFGVRFAFRGHDLHGLIVGPDRRLYFSIGDRGYNVSPQIKDPFSGAVFSCEFDGSDLQVFATGLRNPQELAFDDFGNLFTGDNNSDSGDKARWVYVVLGGDSGWRMYYQYLPDRGPFNREKIWHPYSEQTPAYIVPPIANLSDGPSGLAFYPGTGLTDHFNDRFLLCDFRGAANISGIQTFRLKSKGAGFEIVDVEKTLWNMLATDATFGPDGKLYVADWVFGWQGVGKGRIYAFEAKSDEQRELTAEVQSMLNTGLAGKTDERLVALLTHPDRRIRYAAQFELVDRKKTDLFLKTTLDTKNGLLQRVHSVWGLSILARNDVGLVDNDGKSKLKALIRNCSEPQLLAQLAKLIGDHPQLGLATELTYLMEKPEPRIQFMAGLAIGKTGSSQHLEQIANLLDANRDRDAFIRHSAIMGLKGILARMQPELKSAALSNCKDTIRNPFASQPSSRCESSRIHSSLTF